MRMRHRLTRHPLARAWGLEAINQLRRWWTGGKSPRSCLIAVVGGGAIGVAVLLAAHWWPLVLDVAAPHLITICMVVALQAAVLVHRGRHKWTAIYSNNWLSTMPVPCRAFTRMIALRSFLWPLVFLSLLALISLLADVTWHGHLPLTLLLGCGVATMVGSLLGWWLPQQRVPESSRSPPIYAVTSGGSSLATLAGLSRWPGAQAKVCLQPRSLTRLLLPAMLTLHMDVSANVAVAVLAVWALTIYLFVLLRAIVQVAREGARWLGPTPLTLVRFAWAVGRRPALIQLQWTVIVTGLLVALGCKPIVVMRVAQWWLAVVSVTSSIVLTHSFQSRPMRLKLLASVCALAVIERFKQHLALPCALGISAWQFRKAVRK